MPGHLQALLNPWFRGDHDVSDRPQRFVDLLPKIDLIDLIDLIDFRQQVYKPQRIFFAMIG